MAAGPRVFRVSIHAPVRGATKNGQHKKLVYFVSIHAPVRGATFTTKTGKARIIGFNPRARTGRDERGKYVLLGILCFNPRARTGRDNYHLNVLVGQG